jgi:hypothetical protein
MFDATTYEIISKEMLKDKNYSTSRRMFSTERHYVSAGASRGRTGRGRKIKSAFFN